VTVRIDSRGIVSDIRVSVIYATARTAHCFAHHPDWDQYQVVGKSLAAQTFRNFEVIFVTPFTEQAFAAFAPGLLGGGMVIPPRDTPWRRAKTRCSASARNTGLVRARGDYVVCLDDAVELEPDYLERVVSWLERGIGVASLSANAEGKIIDGRASEMADSSAVLSVGPVALGLVAFPTELGLQLNGWDEHFDGGYGLEDADFGVRLSQAGLSVALDRNIFVRLHDTTALDPSVVADDGDPADPVRSNVRCCNTAFFLAREANRPRANEVPYTREQIDRRLHCFLLHGDRCGYWNDEQTCAYLHMARDGHPVARRIMIDEGYPEVVDLSAERRRIEP